MVLTPRLRRLDFDAFPKPELLKRWFRPRGWSLAVCEVDFRVGGGFRFVLRGPTDARWACAASIEKSAT